MPEPAKRANLTSMGLVYFRMQRVHAGLIGP